jgi:hypothetical protein
MPLDRTGEGREPRACGPPGAPELEAHIRQTHLGRCRGTSDQEHNTASTTLSGDGLPPFAGQRELERERCHAPLSRTAADPYVGIDEVECRATFRTAEPVWFGSGLELCRSSERPQDRATSPSKTCLGLRQPSGLAKPLGAELKQLFAISGVWVRNVGDRHDTKGKSYR